MQFNPKGFTARTCSALSQGVFNEWIIRKCFLYIDSPPPPTQRQPILTTTDPRLSLSSLPRSLSPFSFFRSKSLIRARPTLSLYPNRSRKHYTHVYLHTQAHPPTHKHIRTHTRSHTHTITHTHPYLHSLTHIYSHLHTFTHTLTLTHTHILSFTFTHIHILIHIYTLSYTLTLAHTHILSFTYINTHIDTFTTHVPHTPHGLTRNTT